MHACSLLDTEPPIDKNLHENGNLVSSLFLVGFCGFAVAFFVLQHVFKLECGGLNKPTNNSSAPEGESQTHVVDDW